MAVAYEAKRLNLGKNNVGGLLNSNDFPFIKVGGRKFISALSFGCMAEPRIKQICFCLFCSLFG